MKHGLALCCNTTPEFKHGKGISSFYECPVCHKGKDRGGWSRNKPWIASIWNESFHTYIFHGRENTPTHTYNPPPKLDVEEKWRYAKLSLESHLPYGERETLIDSSFVLFSTEEKPENKWLISADGYECHIDDFRCFKQFSLRSFEGKEVNFNLPKFKGHTPFNVYLNRASWISGTGNGTWYYNLKITTCNYKWTQFFVDKLTNF